MENNLKINFISDTTVKEVDEDKTKYLDYYFEFADSDILESRVNIDKQCSGMLIIFEDVFLSHLIFYRIMFVTMFVCRCDWFAYSNGANKRNTEKQGDDPGAKFKHPSDRTPYA